MTLTLADTAHYAYKWNQANFDGPLMFLVFIDELVDTW